MEKQITWLYWTLLVNNWIRNLS